MDSTQPLKKLITQTEPGEGPFITTISQKVVHFLNPLPEEITNNDIAYSLAKTCRYTGHIHGWYSVAEHTMIGRLKASCKEVADRFLTHDFAEYVFSDLASPVKVLLPDYQFLIENFEKKLNEIFFPDTELYEEMIFAREVNYIDKRLGATEMKVMRDCLIESEPYTDVTFERLDWMAAYSRLFAIMNSTFPERR